MARILWGDTTADVVVKMITTDQNELAPDTRPVTVWDAFSGGTQVTDLQDLAHSAITQVTPTAKGRVLFYAPDGWAADLWYQDADGDRWRIVKPATVVVSGVSSFSLNGETAKTGAVTETVTADSITDATTVGKASIRAADAAAGRTAIGAGTSNLALGTTSTTARAGNWVPTADDVGAVAKTVFPFSPGTVNPLTLGDTVTYDDSSGQWTNAPQSQVQLPAYLLQGAILNPSQPVPGDWPNGAIAFVRGTAPTLGATQIGHNGTTTSSSSLATPLTDTVANGEGVNVSITAAAPSSLLSVITVTDTAGNTYTNRGQRVQSAALQEQVFTARAGSGTTLAVGNTITVSFKDGAGAVQSVGDIEVKVDKVTGLAASPSIDQQGQNSVTNAASLTVSTSATSQANEIAILSLAFAGASNGVVPPSSWATPGWTQIGTTQTSGGSNPRYSATFYKLLTSVGTVSVTPQISVAAGFIALLNTYKAA